MNRRGSHEHLRQTRILYGEAKVGGDQPTNPYYMRAQKQGRYNASFAWFAPGATNSSPDGGPQFTSFSPPWVRPGRRRRGAVLPIRCPAVLQLAAEDDPLLGRHRRPGLPVTQGGQHGQHFRPDRERPIVCPFIGVDRVLKLNLSERRTASSCSARCSASSHCAYGLAACACKVYAIRIATPGDDRERKQVLVGEVARKPSGRAAPETPPTRVVERVRSRTLGSLTGTRTRRVER